MSPIPYDIWDADVSPGAKLVWRAIRDHAYGEKNTAWPSQPRLAEMTGFSVRQIRRYVTELVKAGQLTTKRTGRATLYILTPDTVSYQTGHTDLSDRTDETPHRTHRPIRSDTVSPEATKETTNEEASKQAREEAGAKPLDEVKPSSSPNGNHSSEVLESLKWPTTMKG